MGSSGIALLRTHTGNAGAMAEGQGGAAMPGVVARRTGRHCAEGIHEGEGGGVHASSIFFDALSSSNLL
eukprot:2580163-Pleurochrysis_carterae.AAC.2